MNLKRYLILSNARLIKRLYSPLVNFPRSKSEFEEIISKPLELPANPRLNQIAILGAPNAGKSTLVNSIIGFNICSESSKIHTTRKNLKGIYTDDNVQIELTDTPGCVTSKHAIKHKLEPNFLKDPDYSCNYANIIAILYDCSIKNEPAIIRPLLKILYKYRDKESILILTKTDLVRDFAKRQIIQDKLTGQDSSAPKFKHYGQRPGLQRADMEELFRLTEKKDREKNDQTYEIIKPIEETQIHWPYFSRVFHVSAFDSSGILSLKKYFLETAYPNPWLYNQNLITDSNPTKIIVNIIKSKLLENVFGPAPYLIKIRIIDWTINEDSIDIVASGKLENGYHISNIIGVKGQTIFKINCQVAEALSRLYRCTVNFSLNLEVKPKEDKNLKEKKSKLKKESVDKKSSKDEEINEDEKSNEDLNEDRLNLK